MGRRTLVADANYFLAGTLEYRHRDGFIPNIHICGILFHVLYLYHLHVHGCKWSTDFWCVIFKDVSEGDNSEDGKTPSFTVLLHGALKVECHVAIVRIRLVVYDLNSWDFEGVPCIVSLLLLM